MHNDEQEVISIDIPIEAIYVDYLELTHFYRSYVFREYGKIKFSRDVQGAGISSPRLAPKWWALI